MWEKADTVKVYIIFMHSKAFSHLRLKIFQAISVFLQINTKTLPFPHHDSMPDGHACPFYLQGKPLVKACRKEW